MPKSSLFRRAATVSAALTVLIGVGVFGVVPAMAASHANWLGNRVGVPLTPQPVGTISLGANSINHVQVSVSITGLTPSAPGDPSVHALELDSLPGIKLANLGLLTADSGGRAVGTFDSGLSPSAVPGSAVVVLRLGNPVRVGDGVVNPVAAEAIATAPARLDGAAASFTPVETGANGELAGHTTLTYDAAKQALTVTVTNATGFIPNSSHAAHIHAGTCANQGAPIYMLMPDLTADGNGTINGTRTITGVSSFTPPDGGWYLNIHQGDSNSILVNNQPALSFRPLLCGDISAPNSPQSRAVNTNWSQRLTSSAPLVQAPKHW